MKTKKEIENFLENIQFLSPNEPITPQGIQRVIDQMDAATTDVEDFLSGDRKTITIWNPNISYAKNDIVIYFKQETKQVAPEVDKREFVFVLMSTANDNTAIPNYDMVNGIPDFTKSNWCLINPTSYLLQDLIGMKKVVKDVFAALLKRHVKLDHGLIKSDSIEQNLIKNDYSNLVTPWEVGKYSLVIKSDYINETGVNGTVKYSSNGIAEYQLRYSFEAKANQQEVKILDDRYFYESSPIWDESDQTIFSQKYQEETMLSVTVNPELEVQFNNLRYGTNVFHKHIQFDSKRPFVNDQYMVFFDTYGNGDFVFGYDKSDIQQQIEPTYDSVVSMPMLMNKTRYGFDIVLPIHTHFNSIQKYRIGVPWKNTFTLQVIGKYR